MNKDVEEMIEYLLRKDVVISLIALSVGVPVIDIYKKAIQIFGEREDLVAGLKINEEFYNVSPSDEET